jgi:hypothetical protein
VLRGNFYNAGHFFSGTRIDYGCTTAMPRAYVFRAVYDFSILSDNVTLPLVVGSPLALSALRTGNKYRLSDFVSRPLSQLRQIHTLEQVS